MGGWLDGGGGGGGVGASVILHIKLICDRQTDIVTYRAAITNKIKHLFDRFIFYMSLVIVHLFGLFLSYLVPLP